MTYFRQVILNDNPGEVLSSEGLPDPECLEHLLELVRLVKVKDEDLVTVLPDLICALVAPSDQVRRLVIPYMLIAMLIHMLIAMLIAAIFYMLIAMLIAAIFYWNVN